ncbi:MAG: hypothetical protein BWX84_02197 [Verrucomicrobia bacterium ADurb.Bin118]|nr:MAG: hypothetical protein BWX84_02197 [Verrucomicrobia bacterium ADurb.Bin118]
MEANKFLADNPCEGGSLKRVEVREATFHAGGHAVRAVRLSGLIAGARGSAYTVPVNKISAVQPESGAPLYSLSRWRRVVMRNDMPPACAVSKEFPCQP